ncbi:MAG: glycosyl hydrolase family 28-related protein [Janthinobacterium lividum]
MTKRNLILLGILCAALLLVWAGRSARARTAPAALSTERAKPAAAVSGDRGGGPNVTFPATLLFQNGGPVIDIQHPPEAGMRAAKGDGVTDDTAAFQDVWDLLKRQFQTHGPWGPDNSFYVYLPRGTYKVSDTLIYRGETIGSYPTWNSKFDINHVHFIGQDRDHTIIRLADHCAGFQDSAHPKIVLAFQHPNTVFNNVPGGNWLRNLTIDTGRGNPGAVALFFQGANNTDMQGVTLRSEDGQGRCGLLLKQGSVQGYYADITIQGFQCGIIYTINGEADVALEYLTLRGQTEAGILQSRGDLSLRRILSVQAAGVPALKMDGAGPQTVLIDSQLRAAGNTGAGNTGAGNTGAGNNGPAIDMTTGTNQCLFVRNVWTAGYAPAIRKAGVDVVRTHHVDEYVSYPAKTLTGNQTARSLRLPIADTPQVPWYDPATQWAVVDDYPSVQAALDSGRPVVCFKQRHYKLTGDVFVPATVQVVNGMASTVDGVTFVVNRPSAAPLLFQDSNLPIRVMARRDVIQRCSGGALANPNGLPVTFYLENVNDDASGDDFCRPGSRVFARQIDIEYGSGNQIVSNGGALWIFGFKTENMHATPFTVKNGGSLEILGGYCNQTNAPPPDQQNPILHNDDGRASATLSTNLGGPFLHAVLETRDGFSVIIPNTDYPKRGDEYNMDYVLPLYAGDTRLVRQSLGKNP